MIETQTAKTRIDELTRCQDRAWLSSDDEKRFGEANQVKIMGALETGAQKQASPFQEKLRIGQKVFVEGEKLIGLTTKLLLNSNGHISHLAVRTARLFGRHKVVPIDMVSDVTSSRILLSLNLKQFHKLPEYRADSDIAEEVDRALWGDLVLRSTDYLEIDSQVRDGVVTLNGHVTTVMNQWRAETAVKEIPGILGMKSYLIPDDRLALMVAEAAGQIDPDGIGNVSTKVENGLVVLFGEVSSTTIRDEAEQRLSAIPWVRGVINELRVPGAALKLEDTRFLQPLIGKELIFLDAVSVTVRKVIINPLNRRVVAVLVLGKFPSQAEKSQQWDSQDETGPEKEKLMVLPITSILHLTNTAGFIRVNSDETTKYEDYVSSRYISPDKDWLPPYPYCTNEVLFLARAKPRTEGSNEDTMQNAVNRFDNEGGRMPGVFPQGINQKMGNP